MADADGDAPDAAHIDAAHIDVANTLSIPEGMRLRLADGSIVEVVENPRDGVWLFCKYEHTEDPTIELDVEVPVYAADVESALDRSRPVA